MTLSDRDRQTIWHPYTQMKTAAPPIAVTRCQGAWLYTEDRRKIFDGISSWWVNLHGHSHPEIARRVSEQLSTLEHVIFSGFTHAPAVELAEKLLTRLPLTDGKIFYSDNGSTAVEVALKMAIQYWRNIGQPSRRRILALEGGYHGDTFGAMAASARSAFTAPFDSYLFEVGRIPFPAAGREGETLAALKQELAQGDVAAFIYEPLVQGAGGMRMYPPETLLAMIQGCHGAGTLCIADEVMTGFCRTGTLFASETALRPDGQVENPDLICLSKGLTGGALPLGVTACSGKVYEAFLSDDRSKTLFHGHSFTGNPLACAAALASWDLLEKPECRRQIDEITSRHAGFVTELQAHSRTQSFSPRSRGTILALDFPGEGYLDPVGPLLYRRFLSKGLLLRPLGSTLYVLPPYCTTEVELRWIYECISEAIHEMHPPHSNS